MNPEGAKTTLMTIVADIRQHVPRRKPMPTRVEEWPVLGTVEKTEFSGPRRLYSDVARVEVIFSKLIYMYRMLILKDSDT